ncbi:MAG TPA: GNAT family N-acetyltransferase [Actinomycetales bacterium]|nr:GNAT family N-acetyltransferase [Actinomycetales bacterium]
MEPVLARLETFYDAVPRRSAAVEEHGPLRLFLPEPHAWPYYARPAAPGVVVTPDDVLAVRARQRELGLPEALEWVDDLVPTMSDAAARTGLTVQRCPILVLDGDPAAPPPGVRTRVLGTDDEELALAEAVAALGFGAGIGTRTGAAGAAERDRAVSEVPVARLTRLRELIRDGAAARVVATLDPGADPGADTAAARVVAALDPRPDPAADTAGTPPSDPALCGPLAAGGYQRAVDVAEIVGVATLPAARRRGLGGAVAGALARAALEAGVTTVFLSAQDDTVARVYERVGFRRVGTAGIAEPAP